MRYFARFTLSALLAAVFFLTLSPLASVRAVLLTGIIVNSSADTAADDGTCTLQEAIANANSDSQLYSSSGECAAGSGTDTITFDASLSGGTIYLMSELTLSSDMTIDGSALASQITISGDSDNNGSGDVRVFSVSSGATATLNSLKITQGSFATAGGILNNGTLTVTNSTLSNNIANAGPGGGIRNDGTLSVMGSTFSGNAATASGGGIRNIGALTVTNSTFSGNSATASGGGIYNVAGFISVTITNSTFSGNSAGSQGGGIYSSGGTLNFANTIIANSITNSVAGGDCDGSGTIGSNAINLVEDNSCSPTLSGDPNLGALADNGGPTQTFALGLGSSAIDAGDDSTCIAAPVSNLDQRGVTRPQGSHCDIGAYEYVDNAPTVTVFTVPASPTSLNIPITTFTASDDVAVSGYLITESATPPSVGDSGWNAAAPTTYPVASIGAYTLYPWAKDAAGNVSAVYGSPAAVNISCFASISVTSNADSGAGTLRQAIADACAGATIIFNAALSGDTIHVASTLTLSKNVTIDGSSLATPIIISGDSDNNGTGDVRVFHATGNNLVTIVLDSLIIKKGFASGSGQAGEGGGLLNNATTTITNSFFDSNTASTGGAISTYSALTIIDSTFSGNASTHSQTGGGAILNSYTLTIRGSTFSGNSADSNGGAGGAIFNAASATISNSTFANNSAAIGGAIVTIHDLTIKNSTISGNSAFLGGGLHIDSHVTNLVNTIIANSTAGGDCSNTGTLATNTNNLIEDGSCSSSLSGDPSLDALANNGGSTQTFALLAGSKAINAGDNTTCAAAPISNLDQRGTTRPNGPHCDIGAYEYVDVTTPTITAFSVPASSNSLTVSITAFTASDDVAVTGYLVTETSSPPLAGAAGWAASAPTTHTVAAAGSYTLYPWAKDAIGHVSAVYGTPASFTVETTVPTVVSSVRATASPTNAVSVDFILTFSEAVSGVDASDFSLMTAASLAGTSVMGVSGGPKVYTISINTGSGSGTLRLDLLDNDSITDSAGNHLGGSGLANGNVVTGQFYTIDRIAPTAGNLVAPNVTTSGGTIYSFTVSFSDNLAIDSTSIDGSNIRVTGPGSFDQLAALISVTPAGNGAPRTATYQINVPGGAWDSSDNGTYTIALAANQVFDSGGNPVGATALGSFLVNLNDRIYLPLALR